MKANISSTMPTPHESVWRMAWLRLAGPHAAKPRRALRWSTLVWALALALALAWGAWTTQRIVALSQARIVSVQLAAIMGEFVEAEARKGTDPETARQRIAAYLGAVGQAVEALGKDGTTVLVSEAVVAGPARDVTQELRADVARLLAAPAKTDAR